MIAALCLLIHFGVDSAYRLLDPRLRVSTAA